MRSTTIVPSVPQQPPQYTSFPGVVEILTGGQPAIYPHNRRVALIAANDGGQIRLEDSRGNETISLNGQGGNSTIGGNGLDGALTLWNSTNQEVVILHANGGTIEARDGGNEGRVMMSGANGGVMRLFHPNGGNPHVELVANEEARDNDGGGLVNVMDGGGNRAIRLTGNAGTIEARDILLTNADLAEDFDLARGDAPEPGSVMVISSNGSLKESQDPYDRKVAGVISGAGDYKPGITLGKQSPAGRRWMPVALNGTVFCKADATYKSIVVRDLLVTSPTPAHAMKATDPNRAFGAVIGKALRALESGYGLIPILVSLQ